MSNYGKCRSCGRRILWIRMRSGKAMPVDDTIIYYRDDPHGRDRIVTPDGNVVSCVADVMPDESTGFGYVSHFATCPNANSHRRR